MKVNKNGRNCLTFGRLFTSRSQNFDALTTCKCKCGNLDVIQNPGYVQKQLVVCKIVTAKMTCMCHRKLTLFIGIYSLIIIYFRAAEVSDEVQKLRPVRYIRSDGIIRPYVYREAEGHQILQVILVMFALDTSTGLSSFSHGQQGLCG